MNNGIYRVISEGTTLMGNPHLNESMFMIWLDYSRKMLDLVCPNSLVRYQYSTFVLQIINSQYTPYEKLSKCVEYLIKTAAIIG